MDFFSFEQTLLRLKEELGVRTDKEVAAALGMDVSAFNKRKARGSFPEEKLLQLREARPDMNFTYVLTGHREALTRHLGRVAESVLEYARHGAESSGVQAAREVLLAGERRRESADRIASLMAYMSDADAQLLEVIADRLAGHSAATRHSSPGASDARVNVASGGSIGNVVQSHGNKNAPIKLTAVLPKNKDRGDRD